MKQNDDGKDYASVDLAEVRAECGGKAHLIGMKTEVGGTTVVNDIIAVDYSKTEVDYVLNGSGEYTEGMKAAWQTRRPR